MPSKRQKEMIERIRTEGYDACMAGESITAVPVRYRNSVNREHWEDGWSLGDIQKRAVAAIHEDREDRDETI